MYDIVCTLIHEQLHADSPWMSEKDALLAEKNSPYFQYATAAYKQSCEKRIKDLS
jgi:hypothetical protein